MGRPRRVDRGGYVTHGLNRANGRLPIFQKNGDYEAFLRILEQALEHVPGIRLLGDCLMPNHWHIMVWARRDGELSDFFHWLTLTHTRRWHAQYRDFGVGHLYQGRYKSFPVADDDNFLAVLRYVERNALRANLAPSAADWAWGSLARRLDRVEGPPLSDGPLPLPRAWAGHVDRPQTAKELEALRRRPKKQPESGKGS